MICRKSGIRNRNPGLYIQTVKSNSAFDWRNFVNNLFGRLKNRGYDSAKSESEQAIPKVIQIPGEDDPRRKEIRSRRLIEGRYIDVRNDESPVLLSFTREVEYNPEKNSNDYGADRSYGNERLDTSQKHLDNILGF
jgi:hypothetical protein